MKFKELYSCRIPKYKILWKYSISFFSSTPQFIYLEGYESLINNQNNNENQIKESDESGSDLIDLDHMLNLDHVIADNASSCVTARHSRHEDLIDDLTVEKVSVLKQTEENLQQVRSTYEELILPGHILYIYRLYKTKNSSKRSRLLNCFKRNLSSSSKNEYDYRWATHDEFEQILITNRMLKDHFPNSVEEALKYFSRATVTNIV